MALKGSNNEEKIWNYLKGKGLTEHGVAALMGNLFAESGLNPINLENYYESKLGYTDSTYTRAVDNGTYNNFVRDSAGYGLAQWTYWTRKQNMLNYAKANKASIGDLKMQLGFLYKELSESYKTVLTALKNAKDIQSASDVVLLQFERPADQSNAVKLKRASFGKVYYDKYAGKTSSTTTTTTTTNSSTKKTTTSTKIKKGDKVKVLKAVSYEGVAFKTYYDKYDVIQVSGKRAVIGIGNTVTSSINIKNIKKI